MYEFSDYVSELEKQVSLAEELFKECEKWPVWAESTDNQTWISKVRGWLDGSAFDG